MMSRRRNPCTAVGEDFVVESSKKGGALHRRTCRVRGLSGRKHRVGPGGVENRGRYQAPTLFLRRMVAVNGRWLAKIDRDPRLPVGSQDHAKDKIELIGLEPLKTLLTN